MASIQRLARAESHYHFQGWRARGRGIFSQNPLRREFCSQWPDRMLPVSDQEWSRGEQRGSLQPPLTLWSQIQPEAGCRMQNRTEKGRDRSLRRAGANSGAQWPYLPLPCLLDAWSVCASAAAAIAVESSFLLQLSQPSIQQGHTW